MTADLIVLIGVPMLALLLIGLIVLLDPHTQVAMREPEETTVRGSGTGEVPPLTVPNRGEGE